MPAFNLEHEQRRLSEPGITYSAGVRSAKDSLRTLVAERTYTPSFFELTAKNDQVTSTGYEHRGDLDITFTKSEHEASTDRIAQRYSLETKGYDLAKSHFFDVPLYSTIALMSPTPDIPIPGYPGINYIYFYHVLPGETDNTRNIKCLAWMNRFGRSDQTDILNYFRKEQDVLPTEESILTSPIKVEGGEGTQSFRVLWSRIQEAYKTKGYSGFACPDGLVMEEYLLRGDEVMRNNHPDFDIMVEDLARRLANGATRPEIADDFNTMLGKGHKEFSHKDWGHFELAQMRIPLPKEKTFMDAQVIFARNAHLKRNIPQVMTGCGLSGGMSAGGGAKAVDTWSFTANKATEEKTILCCTCPFCKKEVDAEISEGKIKCPKCKASAPYQETKGIN